jgi:ABC-type transport system substrate-binding protein
MFLKEVKMRTSNFLTNLLVIVLTVTFFSFANIMCNAVAEPRGSITIGLMGEIENLDPNNVLDRSAHRVIHQIFEPLITADNSMNYQPNLATSWNISRDGKAITFNIRKGVKFHDGTPLDSRAVKMTFDRIESQKLRRTWKLYSSFMESVETIDQYTVRINLKGSPTTALAVISTLGYIESPTAVEKYGKDYGSHPSGTGLFKFVEWVPDQRIVLEANKEYWGGEPNIAQVVFKPVPDPQTRLAMIEAGDLDVAEQIPTAEIKRLKTHPQLKIEDFPSGTMFFVIFNTVKEPFNDKRVRQAISYGIDCKGIVNALLFGQVRLAETYAAPNIKHIVKYDIYPYNPEKSKSILESLGWKPGKSGFLEKDGKIFRTAIVTPSGRYPMDRQIAESIQGQLKKIGIDVNVIIVEASAFLKSLTLDAQAKKNAEFGMVILTRPMGPDLDTALTQHFHSSSFSPKATNYSIFVNKELDQILEEGGKTIDENRREALYKKAQDILNEEVPWLPIYSMINFLTCRKGVKGVGYQNPFSFIYVSKEAQLEQ